MGGIQSLSRATYSKLLPANTKETASYFSFFDVLEKLATVLGTFAFGFIEQLTGSMRGSALALTAFFIIGMVLIWKLEVPSRLEKKTA
jgi:MFS transporter, UMF1 family